MWKRVFIRLPNRSRPCRESACNFKILKFSLCCNRFRIFDLHNDPFLTCSVIVNLAWSLKLLPGIRKCLSHGGPSVLQTSFLWVSILKFKAYSNFPKAISRKCNIPSDKLRSCFTFNVYLIVKVLLLKEFWKVKQVLNCLQHRLINLAKFAVTFNLINSVNSVAFKTFLLSKT